MHMNHVKTVLCCFGFICLSCLSVQAEVQGQKITWLTPHALQQVFPDDIDYTVMLTYLEFNEVSSYDCFIFLFYLTDELTLVTCFLSLYISLTQLFAFCICFWCRLFLPL